MKHFYLLLFLFLSTLLLNSCAMMKVQVQVINRSKIRQDTAVIAEILNASAGQVVANLDNGKDIKNAIKDVKNEWLERENVDSSSAIYFFNNVNLHVDSVINEAEKRYKKGLDAFYQVSVGSRKNEDRTALYLRAQHSFYSGDNILLELANKLNQDFGIDVEVKSEAGGAQQKVIDRGEKLREELIKAKLTDDPMLSIVIHAPKKYWKGISNKTVARNFFGQSDVAIAMESMGNYTIKGVRLDASNIVANSYKAMNFSLQLLAGAFGVNPQRMGAQGLVETDNPTEAIQFINTEEEKANLEITRQLNRLAAVSMLDAILSRTELLLDPTTVQETTSEIQIIYNNYKSQFDSHE